MGSGVLLAILVALWFVVLVPMVVTRGDLATAPAEPMRVLRRRSERSAMSSGAMSTRDRGHAARVGRGAEAAIMRTEPIPALPRRVPGATLTSEAKSVGRDQVPPVRAQQLPPVPSAKDEPSVGAKDKPTRAETDIRARRRRMLLTLVAVAVLFAGLASFWQSAFWWPQIVLDLAVFSYVVFLRMEAQREQDRRERRLARAMAKVRLPEDRTERAVRKRIEYQDRITAATGNQSIALDDDDPGFAEMPTWNPNTRVVAEAPAWQERKAV
ncbi:MAG: hypothetical protein M3400_00815 [Actinomycetota bacterium]|nr:hypothetical protein [Actinomycetota bacterium]